MTGWRASLAVVAACAAHPTAGDLASPVYAWDHKLGMCGSQVAVDADLQLWTESGCENGTPRFSRARTLTAAELRRIEAAFLRLAAAGPTSPDWVKQCDGQEHVFWMRTKRGEQRWTVCAAGRPGPGAAGLPPPFDEAAHALGGQ